jgi:ABC-type antimicrobial peptide transport system permease subunit
VVDDVFANKFFPGQDAIGKRLHLANGSSGTVEIVGLVGHVNQWGLDSDATEELRAQLYTPFMQLPDDVMMKSPSGVGLLVSSERPATVFESIRRANEQMSSEQVVFGAQTMNDIIASSLGQRHFTMILFGVFAGLALLLSSVGIYSVVSYITAQRTQEIGVRVALGAQRSDVLRMILREGAKMTAAGVVVGLLAALGLTRLLTKLLFGVSPTDPFTFIAVASFLAVVALAACYIPARRAARVDPMVALRYE